MPEYASTIEVWLEAESEDEANAIVRDLADEVFQHDCVRQTEAVYVEEQ